MRFLILFLILAAQGWGATVYTKGIGGTVYYQSGAASCDDVTAADTAGDLEAGMVAAGANGTLYICAGTYTGAMIDAADGLDTGGNNQIIQAVGSVVIDMGAVNDVAVNGGPHTGLRVRGNSPDVPIQIISPLSWGIHGGPAEVTNANVVAKSGLRTAASAAIANVKVTASAGYAIQVDGTSAITASINYAVVTGSTYSAPRIYISNTHADTSVAINNILVYNEHTPIGTNTTFAGTFTVNNSLLFGDGPGAVVNSSTAGGACSVNNSIIYPEYLNPDSRGVIGCTSSNVIQDRWPRLKSWRYPFGVAFIVDDTGNLTWFADVVVPKLEARGWRGGMAVVRTHEVTEDQWATLKALKARGHEIICHSRHHIQLGTIVDPFTIAKAGATIALVDGTLTTSVPHSYDLSTFTIAALRAQLATDGYTVSAVTVGAGDIPATVLADIGAGTSINAAYAMKMDYPRTYQEAITNSIQDMVAAGITPTTFVPPGNNTSSTLRAYLKDNTDLVGARGGGITGPTIASFDIFDVGFRDFSMHFGDYDACMAAGATEASCIKRNVLAYLANPAIHGKLVAFYTHGQADWDAAQWDALLDAVDDSGAQVMTLTELVNYAKTYDPSGDLATGDGAIYTRTMIDAFDPHLLPTSPAINAGVDVGLTTDIEGKPIRGLPDIGAYEFQKTGGVSKAFLLRSGRHR